MGLNDILLDQATDAFMSKISKKPLKIEYDKWVITITAEEKK